jgi:hypothetical protein
MPAKLRVSPEPIAEPPMPAEEPRSAAASEPAPVPPPEPATEPQNTPAPEPEAAAARPPKRHFSANRNPNPSPGPTLPARSTARPPEPIAPEPIAPVPAEPALPQQQPVPARAAPRSPPAVVSVPAWLVAPVLAIAIPDSPFGKGNSGGRPIADPPPEPAAAEPEVVGFGEAEPLPSAPTEGPSTHRLKCR